MTKPPKYVVASVLTRLRNVAQEGGLSFNDILQSFPLDDWTLLDLPTTTHGEIKLRCVTQPDELQSMLLDRLGITLPKRLRIDEIDLPITLSA